MLKTFFSDFFSLSVDAEIFFTFLPQKSFFLFLLSTFQQWIITNMFTLRPMMSKKVFSLPTDSFSWIFACWIQGPFQCNIIAGKTRPNRSCIGHHVPFGPCWESKYRFVWLKVRMAMSSEIFVVLCVSDERSWKLWGNLQNALICEFDAWKKLAEKTGKFVL